MCSACAFRRSEEQRRDSRQRERCERGYRVTLPLILEWLRRRDGKVVLVRMIFQQEERIERTVIAYRIAAVEIRAIAPAILQFVDACSRLIAQLFDRTEL